MASYVADLMASASSYDECCPSVVDPATLLALIAGKVILVGQPFESRFGPRVYFTEKDHF